MHKPFERERCWLLAADTFLAVRVLLLPACLLFVLPAMAQTAAPDKGAGGPATYVGEKVCANCHAAENAHFGHTVHAGVFRQNPRNERERQVCETCHGPGSRHLANATDRNALIGFTSKWSTPPQKQKPQS